MADTLIATRDGDRLFATKSHKDEFGDLVFEGYVLLEDGTRLETTNVELILQRGYWTEIVD